MSERLTDDAINGIMLAAEAARMPGQAWPVLDAVPILASEVLALREERERLLSISAVMSTAWFERGDVTGWGRCRWCDARSFGGNYIVGGHEATCPVRRLAVLQKEGA